MLVQQMKWQKLGLVYGPDGSLPWAQHSALQPTPILVGDDTIRVFVGHRDAEGVGRVSFVDLSADDPTRVLQTPKSPVLDIGTPGCFDEKGVIPCAIARYGKYLRLYYAGYMCPASVRFIAFSGMAVSADNGATFKRFSRVPVLERTETEPLFRAIHSIFEENGVWRIWYGAGERFVQGEKKTLPEYNIRYMESADGISFPASGRTVIDIEGAEHRVGRPYVCRWHDRSYRMFYGYGSEENPYRLGLAHSADGNSWTRCDAALGLEPSLTGWDSEMIAYPSVITTRAGTFIFYNGNAYGRDGFGVAALKAG